MKRQIRKTKYICLTLLCTGVVFGCAPNQDTKVSVEQTENNTVEESGTVQETQKDTADSYFYEQQVLKNVERFYEETQEQGIEWEEAAKYVQILAEDNLFQDGKMALTGLRLDDIDGNGQMDMLVMVMDAKEEPFYGSGALWFYMNDDEPYCFSEEDCSYYGWFDVFWDDIDSDGNVEIVFSAQGTGCGATGDSYKAVFKYRNPSADGAGGDSENIIRMQLPSDFEYDYDFGIGVEVYQEPEANQYTAYCPYFDEKISFHAQNIEDWPLSGETELVGGEVRGYYDLRVAQYEGKNVLQASEYLNGEGGIVHNVATAQFLITWKEDGTPEVVKWWIEEDKNTYANSRESEIGYSDGYFYYANPADHEYLYRVREDGSEAQCLAKMHAAEICVRDGEIYFADQSNDGGIYRMRTDGSDMKKLCEGGRNVQAAAEYVYFCDGYEAEYDVSGLAAKETPALKDGFLYRMKRDGSSRELIATDVHRYVLSDGYSQEIDHIGAVYYTKYQYIKEQDQIELSLRRVGIDGQKEEELISFRGDADEEESAMATARLMVYGGKVYMAWTKWNRSDAMLFQYDLQNDTTDQITVPIYTDGCIYKGYFYGLCERETDSGQREVEIFRVDLSGGDSETISSRTLQKSASEKDICDIYATGEGVFFRQPVPGQADWKWFRITEDGQVQEWTPSGQETQDTVRADVITVYTTEKPARSSEKFPVVYTDDLSLLERMGQADCSYAERDGNVYYRQYHRDSYEEGALWGIYQATAGTDKEIVRINADGERTVLFGDQGYGDIYLIGNRFYMTESVVEQVEDMEWTHDKVYSVDMKGRDRIDYGGNGSICFVDLDKKCIVMRFYREDWTKKVFSVLNTINGKLTELPLDTDNNCFFWDYHDGWCYFEEDSGDGIYTIVAVSLEGKRREIIALTSDRATEEYGYHEGVCDLRVEGERIYIVFGGYAGSGNFYQGGRILTTKLDGSDYRAIECGADHYYVRQEQGRPLVYFPHYRYDDGEQAADSEAEYETTVWDVEKNITYPCDFPVQLIDSLDHKMPIEGLDGISNPMCVYCRSAGGTDFYALPDDSGRIVRAAMRIDEDIAQRSDGQEYKIDYQHLYYADGYLYFEVEFNVYDKEYAIGWRDGYRRIQTDVYRRRLADGEMELLYSY